MGDGTDLPSTASDYSAQAPSIAFTELYLGYKGKKLGYRAGRFAFSHNTILDIHYYPTKLLDIPFFIFNNNAITGGEISYKLGKHTVKAVVAMDENHLNYENYMDIEGDSVLTDQDGITGIFDAALKFDKITVSPSILLSNGKTLSNPLTAGSRIQYSCDGLLLKAEAAYSESDNTADLYRYSGYILRAEIRKKIGFGTLRFMYDHSRMNYTKFNDVDYSAAKYGNYHYTWLEYTMPMYKSDMGSVVVRPVWRWYYQDMEATGQTYMRNKIELFFQYSF